MASPRPADAAPRLTVLVIGNSVSLPPALGVPAYPERLAERLGPNGSVTSVIRSGATVEEIEPEALEAIAAGRPSAVIVQVGINECAPRPLSLAQRQRLATLRPERLRGLIIRAIHRWRPQIIRLRPLAQFTPRDRFEAAVRRIAAAASQAGARVVLLPITGVTAAGEARTPFTNREVARYNDALRAAASPGVAFIDADTLLDRMTPADYCMTPDTVHLSAAAHERIAEYVAAFLTRSTV